jgi:hypothetical protein
MIYNTSGGKNQDRNLSITIQVVNESGIPVDGAVVDVEVELGGSLYGSGTGAITRSNGEVSYSIRNAPNGLYSTRVTAITKAGWTFEGTTPENAFTKGVDTTPAQFCEDGAVPAGGLAAAPHPAINRARQIKDRHSEALLQRPSVVGHGLGSDGARPVIEVYLDQENADARREIPAQLEGVPVRIVVTGPFIAF